jgi:phosphatidylglycerophosphate synthase
LANAVQAARSSGSPIDHIIAATCPRALVPALLGELNAEGATLAGRLRRLGMPVHGPVVVREGLCVPLGAVCSPAMLETRLFDDLARRTATGDSYLAALIDRRLSRPLTRLLVRTRATPSQITVASLLVGLAGALALATTSYAGRLGGVLLLIVSTVLDCVDGEVARARLEQSPSGAGLDLVGDYVVHLATFAGLGIGLARQGLSPSSVWAASALFLGVIAAMIVIHGLFIQPALARGGDLHWFEDGDSLRGTPVARLVEKLASRDYTYVLLVLALAGRLEWFLPAAAFGAWGLVAGLTGYWAFRRRGLGIAVTR